MGEVGMLFFSGKVRGQGRPRATARVAKGRPCAQVYKRAEDRAYERAIADAYDGPKFEGGVPVRVEVTVSRALPKSKRRTGEGPDVFKPDVDNILKSVMDALTGVAYEDDSQVVVASVCKMARRERCGQDRMVVTVSRADGAFGGGPVGELLHEG